MMRDNLARCISEPRLGRVSHSTSLDSLSPPALPNILRDVIYRKLGTKTTILQSKWVKNWAVLQDNTLYIYADSRETDSVLVSFQINKNFNLRCIWMISIKFSVGPKFFLISSDVFCIIIGLFCACRCAA